MQLSRCAQARRRAMRRSVFGPIEAEALGVLRPGGSAALPPGGRGALRLGRLAAAVLCGCGVLAPPGGERPNGAEPAGEAAPPPPRAAQLDSAAARALGPLPVQLGRFVLDAYAEVRSYGDEAPEPLAKAC